LSHLLGRFSNSNDAIDIIALPSDAKSVIIAIVLNNPRNESATIAPTIGNINKINSFE
jgi:hypothetical protein